MRYLLAAVVLIALLGAGWWYSQREAPAPVEEVVPEESVSAPTNFNEVGILHFPAPDSGQAEGTFEFHDGSATTTLAIAMDPLSVCASGEGARQCVAMSITFDKPFDGKRALMEGIRTGDTILVRKMRVGHEGEELRSFDPGNIFISWPAAITLIEACQVEMAMQTHALDVYLTLKGGGEVRAVEPTIDAMFDVIHGASERCGTFPVGTE